MSFVIAAPDLLVAAAADVAGIGSSITAANAAAALPTTALVAAAEDEVSAAIAALFSGHAQEYQALGAQAGGVSCRVRAGVERGGRRVCGGGGG